MTSLRDGAGAIQTFLIAVGGCREYLDTDEGYVHCNAHADFVLWGKLIKPDGLGPRCYDHAAKYVGDRALGDPSWAIIDLRPLRREIGE
jgi:hypothetical protein